MKFAFGRIVLCFEAILNGLLDFDKNANIRAIAFIFSCVVIVISTLYFGILIEWQGDTLFGLRISSENPSHFMFSTSSYLLPDIAFMGISRLFSDHAFDAVFGAYLAIAAVTIILLTFVVGGAHAALSFSLLWVLSPFQTTPSYHAGVVALCCVFLLLSRTRAKYPVALICLISDPFFAFFMFFHEVLAIRENAPRTVVGYVRALLPYFLLVGVAIAGCMFLSLKVPQYVRFLLFFVVFCLGFLVILRLLMLLLGDEHRRRTQTAFICVGVVTLGFLTIALVARIVDHGLVARYFGPIGVGLLVLICAYGAERQSRPLRPVGLTAVSAALLVSVALTFQDSRAAYQAFSDRYACLDDSLQSRGIDTVATSYWVNQELSAARGPGNWRQTTQIDLDRGGYLLWNGDLRQFSVQANYAIRDDILCRDVSRHDRIYVCAFDETERFDFTHVGELCGRFGLYRSDAVVPTVPLLTGDESMLMARWIVFRHRFGQNLDRFLSRLE